MFEIAESESLNRFIYCISISPALIIVFKVNVNTKSYITRSLKECRSFPLKYTLIVLENVPSATTKAHKISPQQLKKKPIGEGGGTHFWLHRSVVRSFNCSAFNWTKPIVNDLALSSKKLPRINQNSNTCLLDSSFEYELCDVLYSLSFSINIFRTLCFKSRIH